MTAEHVAMRRTRMRRNCFHTLAIALLAAGAAASPAAAQSLLPVEGLSFGVLQPGVSHTVSPDDAGRAIIYVVGSGSLSLLFYPPPALISPQGFAMPLEFIPGDAVLRWRNGNTFPLVAGGTTTVNVPRGQAPAVIHIGGTVYPAADQAAGTYIATLVVQIVTPGT
jgi:hypothetical protein